MIDTAAAKQTFKDATDAEAKALYEWAKTCMEVRGLIEIEGAQPTRKRRSDAGQQRNGTQPTIESVRQRIQPGEQHTLPGDKHQ